MTDSQNQKKEMTGNNFSSAKYWLDFIVENRTFWKHWTENRKKITDVDELGIFSLEAIRPSVIKTWRQNAVSHQLNQQTLESAFFFVFSNL